MTQEDPSEEVINYPLNTEDFQSSDLVEQTPTLTPDSLYWEVDEITEITPTQDTFLNNNTPTDEPVIKKIVSRNVGNTRRRRFR